MSEQPTTATLVQLQTEWQAQLIADALRDKGIDAAIEGSLTSQFRAEAPGYVRILVPVNQLERAREMLEQHKREVSEIDWSTVDFSGSDA